MASKTFSVLTVTKRHGWEKIAAESIVRQTYLPYEWIIVAEDNLDDIVIDIDQGQFWNKCGTLITKSPEKKRLSNLNASLNEGLRYCHGDYVVFYQDFIELAPDCFERLLNLADKRTWVTTCTPNYDGSDDGRYTGCDCPRPCRPEEWEANVSIAPLKMIKGLGGFWEELDWGWSWDNVDLAQRAAMLGAKFVCDESNRPKLYPHEMSSHQTLPLNAGRCRKHIEDIRKGVAPLNCGCL